MKLLIMQSSPVSPLLLSTLFSDTLNLCCSLIVRDQVTHPHKTTGKIISLCSQAFVNKPLTFDFIILIYLNKLLSLLIENSAQCFDRNREFLVQNLKNDIIL
jgi:hypothetical protein